MIEPKEPCNALRRVCLLCGRNIADEGEAVSIVTHRKGERSRDGFAHQACADGETEHDLTGKADYAGYSEDATVPAYSDGRHIIGE